ncbi:MAG: retroviral-like aspartic protease family protein [Clostridiales bacterium]|jgi:hypothetical protein|nr:retroviral-like aspartic protease family protein [Clostridiales bacterium]
MISKVEIITSENNSINLPIGISDKDCILRRIRLTMDTGATATTIHFSVLRRLGFSRADFLDEVLEAKTASGEIAKFRCILIPEIELAGKKFTHYPVFTIETGEDVSEEEKVAFSLLGMDLIHYFDFSVNFGNGNEKSEAGFKFRNDNYLQLLEIRKSREKTGHFYRYANIFSLQESGQRNYE